MHKSVGIVFLSAHRLVKNSRHAGTYVADSQRASVWRYASPSIRT